MIQARRNENNSGWGMRAGGAISYVILSVTGDEENV